MRIIRTFKKIILVVFILTLSTIGIAETNVTITPKALQKGDTVGIIAPANYTPNDASYMIDYLESKGYKIGFLPVISSIFLRINLSVLDKSSMMTTSKLLLRSSTTV